MGETDESALSDLLDRLRFVLREPIDFGRTDSRTTVDKVRLLTAAATYFNVLAVSDFGGRSGAVRAEGLVEQVIAAAFQTFGGVEPHPSPFDKAAMLLRGITQGHPFTDGNKRTGLLVALYFLRRMDFVPRAGLVEAEIVSLCRRVSAGEVRDLGLIAAASRAWTEPGR
jgi:prophage maintenance system killer protein